MDVWRGLRFAFDSPPFVIGVVGAGGKSTLIRRLADVVAQAGLRVLVTTTTRWWVHQWRHFARAAQARSLPELQTLVSALSPGTVMAVVSQLDLATHKAVGVPPEWIDALHGSADVILVEADGARERPLKAPAAHEPVLPERCTHVIPVAGWQGVGKPLTDRWVHRAALFARQSGLRLGDPVSPEALAHFLTHPQGGLRGIPQQAQVQVLINQVDTPDQLEAARTLASAILHSQRVRHVSLASLQAPDPVWETHGRVAAVVLAAGAGKRFGGPKQVALWKGRPLIAHVLDAAAQAGVDEILVVLGAHADPVRGAVADWHQEHKAVRLRTVFNPHWQEGQSTSVRTAIAHLTGVQAALFLMADQPRVSSRLLEALIATHRRTMALAVVPRYAGRPAAPVLFDARAFPKLEQLRGDVGGRVIWQAHEDEVAWVEWPDPRAAYDVDTPSDLEAL